MLVRLADGQEGTIDPLEYDRNTMTIVTPSLASPTAETIPGYGINPMQGAMAGLTGLTTGGTIAQRPTSLFAKGVIDATPIVGPMSKGMPEMQNFIPGQNLGEKLIQGAGAAVGATPWIMGGEALATKIPGLGGAGLLPSLARSSVTGATYGGSTDGIEGAVQGAWMFPAANVVGRVGSALGKAIAPISKEVEMSIAPKPQIMGKASPLQKMVGIVPAETIHNVAGMVGSGVAQGAAGYAFSGGEMSDAMIQGVMGLMGSHPDKTKIKPTKVGVGRVIEKVQPKVKQLGYTPTEQAFETVSTSAESAATATTTVQDANAFNGLRTSILDDLKIDRENVRREFASDKFERTHGIAPGGLKENAGLKNLVWLAEKARLAGDTQAADKYYGLAEEGLTEVLRIQQAKNPMPPSNDPIKTSVELVMDKLNPVPATPATVVGKKIPTISRPLPPSTEAARLREASQKLTEFAETPDSVLERIAHTKTVEEMLNRSKSMGTQSSQIMGEVEMLNQQGQIKANEQMLAIENAKGIPEARVQELNAISDVLKAKVRPLTWGSRLVNETMRIAMMLDEPFGGGIGKGDGPFMTMFNKLNEMKGILNLHNSKEIMPVLDALKAAGLKQRNVKQVLTGGHSFDKVELEGLTNYFDAKKSNDFLIGQIKWNPKDVQALREWVRDLDPKKAEVYEKAWKVMRQYYDQAFPRANAVWKMDGHRPLTYEDNFFPLYSSLPPMGLAPASPHAHAEVKSWRHGRAKFMVPEGRVDPVTSFEMYARELRTKELYDPYIKEFKHLASVVKEPIIDPATGKQMVAGRQDLETFFNDMTDRMATNGYMDDFSALVSKTPLGRWVMEHASGAMAQVVQTFSVPLKSYITLGAVAGSEVGFKRIMRHIMNKPFSVRSGEAINSEMLRSRFRAEEFPISNKPSAIEHFFSEMNYIADRHIIKATYNAGYEYAYDTLFSHMPEMQRVMKSRSYADALAMRTSGVYDKVFKPKILNNQFAKLFLPFQTAAFASQNTLWNDIIYNPNMTKMQKIGAAGRMMGTVMMVLTAVNALKGTPDESVASTAMDALFQGFAPAGGLFRSGGAGSLGMAIQALSSPSPDKLARAGLAYFGPRGSLPVYKIYNTLKMIQDEGAIRNKAGEVLYQFDTQDPAEIMRALLFSPYQTTAISEQFKKKHPDPINQMLGILTNQQ